MKERWLRHDASRHFDSLVCGCLRGGGLQPDQERRGSEPPAENGGLPLVLQDMDNYTRLVGEAGLSGMVGDLHTQLLAPEGMVPVGFMLSSVHA